MSYCPLLRTFLGYASRIKISSKFLYESDISISTFVTADPHFCEFIVQNSFPELLALFSHTNES